MYNLSLPNLRATLLGPSITLTPRSFLLLVALAELEFNWVSMFVLVFVLVFLRMKTENLIISYALGILVENISCLNMKLDICKLR